MKKKLVLLALDPKNVGRLCKLVGRMPNVYFPTMGGEVFWDTICQSNGWKIQKNRFTGHCRVLDPCNFRVAWGSESVMEAAFAKL